jgi:hypothetical protein
MHNVSQQVVHQDTLLLRLAELESACAAALHVNSHLNREVEAALRSAEACRAERDAWAKRAQWLAKKLVAYRKANEATPVDEAAAVADLLERAAAPEYSPSQDQNLEQNGSLSTPSQQRLLRTLQERGAREGWLIKHTEVGAMSMLCSCPLIFCHLSMPFQLQVQLGPVLGQGMFGTTYKGTWRGAQVCSTSH